MERADAIRKVQAMRNTNGRTDAEAAIYRAKALEIMASHGLSESDVAAPKVFDFSSINWNTGRADDTRTREEAEFVRQAREAAFWAARAKERMQEAERQARAKAQGNWWQAPPKAKSAGRKSPNRGEYTGPVRDYEMDPKDIKAWMRSHGIRTNGDLATTLGVSASLVSEWMGKGRQRLVTKSMWTFYTRKAGF